MSESTYLVNGNPIKWTELIKLARKHGYEEDDRLYTTSRATQVLRECGFTVEDMEGT